LFEACNNVETKLIHKITPTSKYLIVEDASKFPGSGILRIASSKGTGDPEIIFYARKIGNQFHLLQRGMGKFNVNGWDAGSVVSSPVMAEHHNALKDAIMKIEQKVGLASNPSSDSIHGIIRRLEQRWLAPKASFKAYPTTGSAPLIVRFQNFSGGHSLHFLWDFGDGTTSSEKHPVHTYEKEGIYSVKLNMISVLKSQGATEKKNYIKVNNDLRQENFYAKPSYGYSRATAEESYASERNIILPTEFLFIDQTEGKIIERHWFFGDNQDCLIINPNIHVVKHIYNRPGNYSPTLIIKYIDDQVAHANIFEDIMVY
jgi:PKD repeat protein